MNISNISDESMTTYYTTTAEKTQESQVHISWDKQYICRNGQLVCVEISLGPSIQYIPLRVYRAGGFNASAMQKMNDNRWYIVKEFMKFFSFSSGYFPAHLRLKLVVIDTLWQMLYMTWCVCVCFFGLSDHVRICHHGRKARPLQVDILQIFWETWI